MPPKGGRGGGHRHAGGHPHHRAGPAPLLGLRGGWLFGPPRRRHRRGRHPCAACCATMCCFMTCGLCCRAGADEDEDQPDAVLVTTPMDQQPTKPDPAPLIAG
jgi:hypothetical protein